jgi:hypothetical protein
MMTILVVTTTTTTALVRVMNLLERRIHYWLRGRKTWIHNFMIGR